MPRLIVLLLAVAALAILALQNLATTVPMVVLGRPLLDIPLGLLLVAAVGIGAFLTLILYGLVGVGRSANSKYKPMGRRVPYPEGPGSSLPPSGPPASGPSGSPSAFVSEPTADASASSSVGRAVKGPSVEGQPEKGQSAKEQSTDSPPPSSQPFITPPPNAPVQDSPPTSPRDGQARRDDAELYSNYASAYPEEGRFANRDTRAEQVDRDIRAESARSESSRSESSSARAFVQQPIDGLKSVFGKKKDREMTSPPKPVGDDWGELRTTEQRNTWDMSERNYRLEDGAKSLLNFGRNVGENAGRIAEDIASGWGNQTSRPADYDAASYDQGYADNYYGDAGYSDRRYDELEQGWENFDDYSEPPVQGSTTRTYGDSLYDDADAVDGRYADQPTDEIGPDGVYDADYRVIEPPDKPLPDVDDARR